MGAITAVTEASPVSTVRRRTRLRSTATTFGWRGKLALSVAPFVLPTVTFAHAIAMIGPLDE